VQDYAAARPRIIWTAKPTFWLFGGLALLALIAFRPSPANAQFFQIPGLNAPTLAQQARARRQRYYRRRYVRRKKAKAPKVKPAWYPKEPQKDPIQLIVSIPEQKVTVYQGDKALTSSRLSTGKKGYDTPTGVFSILSKARWHRSNIYSGAPMPFMQRLTWSGISLHASNAVPNHPASHGCVRLPNAFAPQLYYFTQTGIHVVIARKKDVVPAEIVSDKLIQPEFPAPKDFDTMESKRILALSGVKTKEKPRSTAPLRILVTRRTGRERLMDVQRLLNELQFNAGDVDGWMGPDTAKAIRRFQRTYADAYGLSKDGLVTDELIAGLYRAAGQAAPSNGHIYVRQNFKQLFDGPATIRNPEKPLGVHLMTAQYFQPGDKEVRWLYVSLNKKPEPPRHEVKLHSKQTMSDEVDTSVPPPEPSRASEALDRIEIPKEMRERLSRLLTPGSSLAISDDGLSKETHPKGTDFVVLTN
jgi:hypothetical protein